MNFFDIKFQVIDKKFNLKTYKYIKLQQGKFIFFHPNPAIFINDREISWQDPIVFHFQPQQNDILFEIFQKHVFGYNPEEFKNIFHGEIKINPYQLFDSFPVYNEELGKIIGYLSIKFKHHFGLNPQKSISEKYIILINSIVSHVPSLNNRVVFFQLKIGSNSIRTYQTKTITGELVFVEKYRILKDVNDSEGKLSLYSRDQHNQQKSKIFLGEGRVIFDEEKFTHKILLLNTKKQTIGEAFLNFKIIKQNSPKSFNKSRINSKVSVISSNKTVFLPKSQRFQELLAIDQNTYIRIVKEKSCNSKHKRLKRTLDYKIGRFQSQKMKVQMQSQEIRRQDVINLQGEERKQTK